jgi:hypothetical protein
MFYKNCSKNISDAIQEFRKKWDCLYRMSVLQQKKWMISNHDLEKDDLVLIQDLTNKLNYPRTGKISAIEEDGSGIERYYHVTYKDENKKKDKTVKRSAQSLVLLLKKSEDDAAKISDSLFWCPNSIDIGKENKKIEVKISDLDTEEILDL